MPLQPGDKLGPYEISEPIGKGGMGEVYKAHDSRLRRDVAIKVSAERFNERFERETRAVAALNHPNVCQIYDVGPNYLVMELIDGPTLGDRIKEGAIPLDEALPIAEQIAAALEAAHEKAITHRDLKPGNIKVKSDGTVKVLDFGLAKMGGTPVAPSGDSPTLSMAATQAGMILGTAGYMAPEQAKGKPVDKRVDIWAFGVVLYEMVTGKRLFQGDDMLEILAAVVHGKPDLSEVPPRVRRLIAKCLEKDPAKRLRDMSSVAILLEGGDEPPSVTQMIAAPAAPAVVPRWTWAALGALALTALIAGFFAWRSSSASSAGPSFTAHLTMDLAPAEMLGPAGFFNRSSRTAFAVSPDGATVVFGGEVRQEATRKLMLYRRALSNPAAVVIPGTERAEYPFFSPDGQWVGFAQGNKLKKVALSGGPPIDICDFTFPGRIAGASWGSSGIVAFVRRGLWTVSDSGGKPEVLLEDNPLTAVYSPALLPDGHTVLFTEVANSKWEEAHVDAIDLKTKQRKTLIPSASDARYSPTGHLVFMRDAALLAVPFDTAKVEVTGPAVPLLAGIMQSTNAPNGNDETGMGQFALSDSGTLLYAAGSRYPTANTTLVRADRKGTETKIAEIRGTLGGVRLSPDGSRAVGFKTGDGSRSSDLWLYELPSGSATRLTSIGTVAWPLFSADGKSLLHDEGGRNAGMYSLSLSGNSTPQNVMKDKPGLIAASISRDGMWLAYLETVGNVSQIFVRPMQDSKPSGEVRQFSPSTFVQRDPAISPDGRWLAYVSNESGSNEVYVQAFPGPGEKHRISSQGGMNPAWSHNSQELFYLVQNRASPTADPTIFIMAVSLATTGVFKAREPEVLFDGPYFTTTPLRSYDVTSGGDFIMLRQQDQPPDERVTKLNVVLGWAEELKRRVPTH